MKKLFVGVLIVLLFCSPAFAVRGSLPTSWFKCLSLGSHATNVKHDIQDMFVDGDNLWIVKGVGENGQGRSIVQTWDDRTLTTLFEIPNDITYTGTAITWFMGKKWGSNYYFTSGNDNTDEVTDSGDVYKWNGSILTKVLDTVEGSCYPIEEYSVTGKLYAGCGSLAGGSTGKLYESSNGTDWSLTQSFAGNKVVRSIIEWNSLLYIGFRVPSGFYSYDGTTFTDLGTPALCTTQVKNMVVHNGKLYIGCVPAVIYSYDGSGFTLELDARTTDSEIYQGKSASNGKLYFVTRYTSAPRGRIYEYDGSTWTEVYQLDATMQHFHSLEEFESSLYAGGSNSAKEQTHLIRRILDRAVPGVRGTAPVRGLTPDRGLVP